MTNTSLGDNIKSHRLQRRMTLTALAREALISKSYLHSIENGLTDAPSVYIVARLAGILDVSIETLIGSIENPAIQCPLCKGEGWVFEASIRGYHFGDPCIFCGIAHDDVSVGDCLGGTSNSSGEVKIVK